MISFIKSFLALFFVFWVCVWVFEWLHSHPVIALCIMIPFIVWAVRYEIKTEANRK